MTTEQTGRVVRDGQGVRLEFSRTYDVPVEQVWSAVTDPDRLDLWFGRWTGDPASGTVEVVMTAEGDVPAQQVAVDACEPPYRLAVTTAGPDGAWPLEVTLQEQGTGTALRFVHHLVEPYDATSIGPGWQYYLDRLDAVVAGTPVPDDFDLYYPTLASAYAVPPT